MKGEIFVIFFLLFNFFGSYSPDPLDTVNVNINLDKGKSIPSKPDGAGESFKKKEYYEDYNNAEHERYDYGWHRRRNKGKNNGRGNGNIGNNNGNGNIGSNIGNGNIGSNFGNGYIGSNIDNGNIGSNNGNGNTLQPTLSPTPNPTILPTPLPQPSEGPSTATPSSCPPGYFGTPPSCLCVEGNTAYFGNNARVGSSNLQPNHLDCQRSCADHPKCNFWTWVKGTPTGPCFLKHSRENVTPGLESYVSGSKLCSLPEASVTSGHTPQSILSPTPSPSPTLNPTPSLQPSATSGYTPQSTPSPTPSPSPTSNPTPSPTPSLQPSATSGHTPQSTLSLSGRLGLVGLVRVTSGHTPQSTLSSTLSPSPTLNPTPSPTPSLQSSDCHTAGWSICSSGKQIRVRTCGNLQRREEQSCITGTPDCHIAGWSICSSGKQIRVRTCENSQRREERSCFTEKGVIGKIGKGRRFNYTTVQVTSPSKKSSGYTECCTVCQAAAPDTSLYMYNSQDNRCYCRKPLPGMPLMTNVARSGDVAGFCDAIDKDIINRNIK